MTLDEVLVHRVAYSEQYRAPPQIVRAMPFRDFVIAHLMLDYAEAVRKEQERDHGE